MRSLVQKFAADRSGATAIEYELIAVLISTAVIAGATKIGINLSVVFTTVDSGFK